MADLDVTDDVEFGNNDDEALPIKRCVCGLRFGLWNFIISIYRDMPHKCNGCGRRLYFSNAIRVYQVVDD